MKRKLLLLLLSLLLLSTAVSAAERNIPVIVDDALLPGTSYVEQGVTSVPLRFLMEALGDWQVSWDKAEGQAAAESASGTIQARPGEWQITVNDRSIPLPSPIYIKDGRTYVPLRPLCEALGCSVFWDTDLQGAAVRSGKVRSYPAEDLYWLSRIISAESRGESLVGQIAVGNVVLNRVASPEFPDSIRDVIFDRKDGVQFEPVSNGSVYEEPTARSVIAAKAVLNGSSTVGNCLYFYAPALSDGTWIRTHRSYFASIGCHRFYL